LRPGTAVVLYLGVRNVQAGVLSLGELVLLMSYLARLYLAFQEISKNINLVRAFLKDDHQPLGCRARGIRTAGAKGWIYSARGS